MKTTLPPAICRPALRCRRIGLLFGLVLLPGPAFGQNPYEPYTVTTLAGAPAPGSADGLRSRVRFNAPTGLAIGPAGNLYVADTGNSTIRTITPDGAVTTIAGIARIEGSADGAAGIARFNQPRAVAVDATGTIYVADTGNHTIRKIAFDGTVSTVAGLAGTPGSADGTGRDARFNGPAGVAVDPAGNVYVADTGNDTLRRIAPDGTVTTVAGSPGSPGDADGAGSAARFDRPGAVAVDAGGNIYVAQWYRGDIGGIRQVTPAGQVTTVALTSPFTAGLAVDASGTLYAVIKDGGIVQKVASGGTLVLLAGNLDVGGHGNADGLGRAASFRRPSGIAVDSAGTVYVADTENNTIRKGTPPDPSANVLWAAGSNADGELGDGTTTDRATPVAIRAGVMGVAAGQSHSLLVAADSSVSTAGANTYGQLGDGTTAARNTFGHVIDYGSAVAAGANHSLFLEQGDGALWAAGRNHYGQLGDGTTTDHPSPVLINRNSDPYFHIRAAAAGADHTLFLASDGTLWGTGYNGYGQLGAGAGSFVTRPVQIASGVRAVAGGGEHSLFIKDDGTLWAMGYNRMGQLGDGTGADRATPVPITADVWQVAAGYHFSLFVKTDGTLWGMGESAAGELGGMYGDVIRPVQIATGVRSVSAGQNHTLFVKTDGTLWAMGDNHYGQLGDGTTTASLAPVQIADHVRTIAAGANHSLFVVDRTIDGSLPSITAQPQNQIVTSGQYAAFSVAIDSNSPATCQWQRRTGASGAWTDLRDTAISGGAISGASTPGLAIAVTTTASGDGFRCFITNDNGGVISDPAIVSVLGGLSVGFETLAGRFGNPGSADGIGDAARFQLPTDIAIDQAGNVYVADTGNHTIRKLAPGGTVSTLAGSAGASGSADGTGAAARFNHPTGVAVDAGGNVYVADTDNNTLRKITPAGAVTTVAGQIGLAGNADGVASAARFNGPSGIAVDGSGNLYVADTLNHAIRRISSAGLVTTLAGSPGNLGYADGSGNGARFFGPQGVALDGGGTLYVADTDNCAIRRVGIATGSVTTVAGRPDQPGSGDGPMAQALFKYPSGLSVGADRSVYVADTENNAIRRISPDGVVTTVAGGPSAFGWGPSPTPGLDHPTAVQLDSAGGMVIADTDRHQILLAYIAAAPVISAQPQSQAATVGANVTFSVSVSGRPTPTYQWNFNGTAIAGATSSTLSLNFVRFIDAGGYTVTVTNSLGSVTSNPATLTVNAADTPAPGGGGAASGGGGAPSIGFLVALVLLTGLRCCAWRRARPSTSWPAR